MHLVHYIKAIRSELGGVVQAMRALCGALAQRGHQVTVLTDDARDVRDEWTGALGVPRVIELKLPALPLMPLPRGEKTRLSSAIAEADVVHLHTLWDTFNLTVAALADDNKVPYVVSTHGMLDEWAFSKRSFKKKAFMSLTGKNLLERASAVHCTAQGEQNQVQPRVPNARYFVAPHYFDWSLFEQLPGPSLAEQKFPGLASDRPKVLSLSRLHPVKGADLLIDAAAQLISVGQELDLILAGPDEGGFQIKLENQVSALGLGERVHFLGMVRGAEKVSLYQACDLFALPTHQENFGIVLAEAMAAELPLVTTPQVDIWPELESGGGVIVKRTAESFAKAIGELLSGPERLRQRGVNGREFVVQWLDQESISKQFEEMYAGCTA